MRYCFITLLLVSLAGSAVAQEPLRFSDIRSAGVLHGGSPDAAKAAGDTVVLIGPASLTPVVVGTFQNAVGEPDWNGWTSLDWTAADTTDTSWHASTYNAIDGAYSAYCGDETIPSCGGGDPVGGYGNHWSKLLKWGATVADPGVHTHIDVSFDFDVDSEGGYDWALVARERENEEREDVWHLSGDSTGSVTVPVTYMPDEYFGNNLDEIGVWFVGESDEIWSDLDCAHPSTGIWRLDNVTITADNGAGGTGLIDFEDGTLGPLERKFRGGVGDFAHILGYLGDPDPCTSNPSPQVTFIDDGIVQPATGGSRAKTTDRMYADGWVVNYTGGLTFSPQRHLHNTVVSPVIPWQDASHDGAQFGHTFMTDSFYYSAGETGIYMEWHVRSTDGDAASIEDADWLRSPYVYTGGPYYGRRMWDVSSYFVPGRTYVQVALGVWESNYVWGMDNSSNPSPSPYYDNVRLESFNRGGPAISTPTYRLAQDAFPEIGDIDTDDLGRNHIRFDQAQNISSRYHEHYHNGDSVTIDVVPLRTGAALTGRPRFHYELLRNSVFDPYRTSGLPDSGVIVMDTVHTAPGTVVPDRFRVDLPDSDFLFPGDVLHYYFSAEDAIGGPGGTAPLTATMPDDISGFGQFDGGWRPADPWDGRWSNEYTMRGLPSLVDDPLNPGHYFHPTLLIWDDAESETGGSWLRWRNMLENVAMSRGEDYDYYYAKAPSSGVGSGLGARATVAQLAGYRELFYHSGDLATTTLSDGDWGNGGSDDIGLLEGWLDLGSKDLFLCGSNLAKDLSSGTTTRAFLNDRMRVIFVESSHYDLLGGQLAPRVLVAPGNPVFATVDSWLAYGACPDLRNYDLVISNGGQRLAVWADATGANGGYPYSPVTLAVHGNGSRIISMAMDLGHVHTDAQEGSKADASLAARSRIFRDVTSYFGIASHPITASPVPEAAVFSAVNHPNPFNPVTEIAYTIKAPGHLILKIFNLRGELVRILVDGHVEQAGRIPWDGTDSHGGQVSSGVYFYEARMGGEVQVGKMALVK